MRTKASNLARIEAMDDTIELVIIAGLTIVVFGLAVALVRKNQSAGASELRRELKELEESVGKLRDGLTDKLGQSQQLMVESLQKQFSASSKLIGDVTKNLTELKESNKQVVGVTDELKTLQNILQNPKQRGVLGEYYLQSVLENVLPPERFSMQYSFKDGQVVDAVIYLDKKILPIDSKFSLENYNRLVEEKNKARRETLTRSFKADLKNRIDETAKYIRPDEDTMDFAFMFIPSEAIYYDLLINKIGEGSTSSRDLIEYAFRDKNVIIVSPTSFLAYLQTVMQGLRSLKIEEQAKEIQKRVGLLGRHVAKFDDVMARLGKSLGTTVNHYNTAHKELGKIDTDVIKISGTERAVEPLELDRPKTDE
jgi:DNA recombination protein RmuC